MKTDRWDAAESQTVDTSAGLSPAERRQAAIGVAFEVVLGDWGREPTKSLERVKNDLRLALIRMGGTRLAAGLDDALVIAACEAQPGLRSTVVGGAVSFTLAAISEPQPVALLQPTGEDLSRNWHPPALIRRPARPVAPAEVSPPTRSKRPQVADAPGADDPRRSTRLALPAPAGSAPGRETAIAAALAAPGGPQPGTVVDTLDLGKAVAKVDRPALESRAAPGSAATEAGRGNLLTQASSAARGFFAWLAERTPREAAARASRRPPRPQAGDEAEAARIDRETAVPVSSAVTKAGRTRTAGGQQRRDGEIARAAARIVSRMPRRDPALYRQGEY